MTDISFSSILEKIADLHTAYPDYSFEYISEYIYALDDEESNRTWVVKLYNEWQEMSENRQIACSQIFQASLQRAQQATYRPVNALDAFLERQLYGIEDDKVVEKGLISGLLDQQKRRRPPRPGRTSPLSPNVLRPPEG